MAVVYEWDIETVDTTYTDNPDLQDIIDHNHSDKCPGIPTEADQRLVLVRDAYSRGGLDRTWAYVTVEGKLPDHFEDAYGCVCTRVPKRFHAELERT